MLVLPQSVRAACSRPSWTGRAWRAASLALVVTGALIVRIWLIRRVPEPDTDVPGHLGIARGLLHDPTNVAIHWVWLPAYHYLLAGLLALGLSAFGIRALNCALAALVPPLVMAYGTPDGDARGADRDAPWMAAVLSAVSPLVNLLGTSAQQETLFTLLVVGAAWSVDKRRFGLAGGILAVASLIRYEIWGAVLLLVCLRAVGAVPSLMRRVPATIAPCFRVPLVAAVPSIVAVGGWLLAHKLTDGQWIGFLRELYRYTQVQRDSLHRGPLWFPVEQPLFVFGWVALALFFVGLRGAWRASYVIPLGIYLFLIAAYLFKGALGSARYYESLTPFIALSAAHGACAIGARRRWVRHGILAIASWQLAMLSVQLFRWTWPDAVAVRRSSSATHAAWGTSDPRGASASASTR